MFAPPEASQELEAFLSRLRIESKDGLSQEIGPKLGLELSRHIEAYQFDCLRVVELDQTDSVPRPSHYARNVMTALTNRARRVSRIACSAILMSQFSTSYDAENWDIKRLADALAVAALVIAANTIGQIPQAALDLIAQASPEAAWTLSAKNAMVDIDHYSPKQETCGQDQWLRC